MLSRLSPFRTQVAVKRILSPTMIPAPIKTVQFNRTLFDQKQTAAPPQLPKEEQEEFERLQKLAQTNDLIAQYNEMATEQRDEEEIKKLLLTKEENDIGQMNVFKTIPEFEGDVNPVTGEIGGPKQDPLRHGDYSFNGRVTDF